jgi:23S rRNA (uracil-5-)-methyltransferase RumA
MKFGDLIRGQVSNVDDKGRGLIEPNIVIPFTSPGDEVEATFVKRDKGSKIAKLASVTKTSPDRIDAPCPHAGTCGGCLWQHMEYGAQIRLKQQMINRAFEHAGHEERIDKIQQAPDTFYYRNRMDYVFGWKGELGLKEYGQWNRYLDLSTCLLLDKETPTILDTVRKLVAKLGLEPWDAKKYTGDIRYTIIRLGKNTNERMITLLVKDLSKLKPHHSEITEALSPFCTTLYLGENPEITDVSLAKTLILLHGNEYLTERVNEIDYLVHPNSFFQTNTHMAGELQSAVMKLLPKGKILDLFCGSGFLGIAAAKDGHEVYGHEIDAPAIELAQNNAKANNVADKCRWGAGPVESLDWSAENPDAVIIDPPRAGLHPKALKALLDNRPPTIVYVSCNYHRLVDELKQLKTLYKIDSLQALDLFPHTPHVEVVVKLSRLTK